MGLPSLWNTRSLPAAPGLWDFALSHRPFPGNGSFARPCDQA